MSSHQPRSIIIPTNY